MARHVLSKKDMKIFFEKLKENNLWADFFSNSNIEVEEHKGKKCYSIGGRFIAYEEDRFLPSIDLLNAIKPEISSVTVDNGAVPHILNGAKLFGKGITQIGEGIRTGSHNLVRIVSINTFLTPFHWLHGFLAGDMIISAAGPSLDTFSSSVDFVAMPTAINLPVGSFT